MLSLQDIITIAPSGSDTASLQKALVRAENVAKGILPFYESSEKTEIYDGNGEYSLVLKRNPVSAISEMKFDDEIIDPNQYFLNKDTGIVRMYFWFPRGFNIISVTYTAGYTVDNIPQNLKNAILDLAMSYFTFQNGNIRKESIDGASVEYESQDITPYTSIISQYASIYV